MRIMLDTNIWISLFVFKGKGFEELIQKVVLQHTLVMSPYIINELFEVIYKKFPGKTDALDFFLSKIPYEIVVNTRENQKDINVNIRDKNDREILISAILANVDLFISGDKDFEDVTLLKPEILTPKEFLDKY